MHILRRLGLGFAAFLLPITLFWFGLGLSLWQVFSGPAHIEKALSFSGLYSKVVPDTLRQQAQPGSGGLPIDQPQIQMLVHQSFSPQVLQQSTENILNSTYAWLQGKIAEPNFLVDLTDAKNNLAERVAAYASQRLNGLPTCPLSAIPQTVDAFSATCLPPGFDKSLAVAQARESVLGSEALAKPVLSNDTFKADNGQLLSQKFKQLPQRYHQLKQGLYLLAIISTVAAVAIIFLHVTWRNGVRRVGRIMLGTGLSTVVMAILVGLTAGLLSNKVYSSLNSNQALAGDIVEVVRALVGQVRNWWLGYGIIIAVLGAAAMLIIKYTTPKAEQKVKVPELPTDKKTPVEKPATKVK